MRKAHKLNIDPKMESKDQFNKHFDKAFDAIYDAIDVPHLSLFKIVDQIKSFKFVIDSKLVQIIIQNKLDHHFADYRCPNCGKGLKSSITDKDDRQGSIIYPLPPLSKTFMKKTDA